MKVEEAKTKVCPFIQDGLILSLIRNDENFFHEGQPINCLCIAGECMAWAYTNTHKQREGFSEINKVELLEEEKEGYCKRLGND